MVDLVYVLSLWDFIVIIMPQRIRTPHTHLARYKAVFSSPIDTKGGQGALAGKSGVGGGGLLSGWVLQRVADFLQILEEHLPRLTDRFNTVLGQCMHFALSLGRVGMDFRPLLAPLFEQTIADLFSSRIDLAFSDFVGQVPTMALVAHSTLPDADTEPGMSDAPIAPLSLMAFPILARLTNNLLSALNDLRECAPLAVGHTVAASLSSMLVSVSTQLADYYAVHRETFDARDKTNFSGLAQMYIESLVPCVVRCVDAIYPESAFQSGTQTITPPALVIDRVAIARPLVPFCAQAEAILMSLDGSGPAVVDATVATSSPTSPVAASASPTHSERAADTTDATATTDAPASSDTAVPPATPDDITPSAASTLSEPN